MGSTEAMADAIVRFVHGVPGVGTADVSVQSGSAKAALGAVSFAQATPWKTIPSGSFHWSLSGGNKTLASGIAKVGTGAYDIVVLLRNGKVSLGIYPARGGTPGSSLVRVIHGAPELGSPSVQVDGKTVVPHLAYTIATPYLTLKPGQHSFSAMRPGSSAALVSVPSASLKPGVSYSAVVLGTRGQMTRVILLADRAAPGLKPAAAPPPTRTGQPPATGGPGTTTGGTVTIRSGDCLWYISRKVLGPGASDAAIAREVQELWRVNAQRIGSGSPNVIYPGITIQIPRP